MNTKISLTSGIELEVSEDFDDVRAMLDRAEWIQVTSSGQRVEVRSSTVAYIRDRPHNRGVS